MTGNASVFLKIVEHLTEIGVPKNPNSPITCDTEVYRDLGIYGDVLVFDLVLWLNKEFGVECNLNPADYAPSEWPLFQFWEILRKMVGIGEPQYKSLKIRDIVAVIEAKRWPAEAQANRT